MKPCDSLVGLYVIFQVSISTVSLQGWELKFWKGAAMRILAYEESSSEYEGYGLFETLNPVGFLFWPLATGREEERVWIVRNYFMEILLTRILI